MTQQERIFVEKFFGEPSHSSQSRGGSKFWNLKIVIFLITQNFGTNQGLQSKSSHTISRIACPFSYAKEMRRIGPKMTKLEPFSWQRSKFLKIRFSRRITIFDFLLEILIFAAWAQVFGYHPQPFLSCLIIALEPQCWGPKIQNP